MIWKEIKNETQKKEQRWLTVILIIGLAGVLDEVIARIFHPLFYVLNFDSVSLAILSIQATVATLVLTILSLMTNKMDASYIGVSINDFLLNIKPWIFKQKRIIISEIVLIVGNVFIHMAGWYNIVVTIFIISMLLVIISVSEIYEAFLGSEKINEEIEAYLKDTKSGSGREDKKDNKKTRMTTMLFRNYKILLINGKMRLFLSRKLCMRGIWRHSIFSFRMCLQRAVKNS